MMSDISPTTQSYLHQANASSIEIQREWIKSVLKEAAASALRSLVLERALLTQRSRRYDDSSSISSIEDDPVDRSNSSNTTEDKGKGDDDEVVVTQEDIDAAYKFAERVGREWAKQLAKVQDDGTNGIQSSADLVLDVVANGEFLEDDGGEDGESMNEEQNGEAVGASRDDDAESSGMDAGQDTAANLALLAKPEDAITPEVAISRLTAPPVLLIGHKPFGKPLDRIPPNPIVAAAVATAVNTGASDIKAKNEAADKWRRSISERIDELGRNGKTGWMYPWDVVEKACDYNVKRMESGRNAAITTSELSSGRAAPEVVEQARLRKRARSALAAAEAEEEDEEEKEDNSATVVSTPIVPRPPCTYSGQEWTVSDLRLSLGEGECKALEDEMIHPQSLNDQSGEQDEERRRRAPSPLPPSCVISGHLQHLGSTQLWEKSKYRSEEAKEDNTDIRKARRKRKRVYRKAKAERMGGGRAEKDNDARLDIEKRISKVTRAFEAGGEDGEGREWFELDIGGCLVEIDGDETKDTLAFRTMEISLSLDD